MKITNIIKYLLFTIIIIILLFLQNKNQISQKTIDTFNNNKLYDSLINLGFNTKDIDIIYTKLNNEQIENIIDNKYNNTILNYINLNNFNYNYLERYIKYHNKNKNLNNEQIVTNVNIGLDNKFYTNINIIKEPDKIDVLVNKYHKLDKTYKPNDLTLLNKKYATTNQYLRQPAHDSFIKMCDNAKNDNIYFYAGSTYRSYNYQEWLYNKYILDYTFDAAEKFSARAGHSEHQTGLAVDILNKNLNYLSKNDIEYNWLISNSYKYGFILRYPKDKENITGYIYEPWHFRYLGIDIAKKLYNSNLTYEEYIAKNK